MAKDDSTTPAKTDDVRQRSATVPNVHYRSGYKPGDVAGATLYRSRDGKIGTSLPTGGGVVLVQEGDTVSASVARDLANG